MRWLAVFAIFLLISATAWLVTLDTGPTRAPLAQARQIPPPPVGEDPPPELVSVRSPLHREREEVREPDGFVPAAATRTETGSAALGVPSSIKIRGRVDRIEEPGGTVTAPSGSMTATLWKGNSGKRRTVDVLSGRFQLSVPSDIEELSFQDCAVGGTPMVLEQEHLSRYPVDPAREIVLRCHAPRQLRLLVRDAASRADLRDVCVRQPTSGFRSMEHPGNPDSFPIVASGDSPLAIRGTTNNRGATVVLVGAPGRAWKRVTVDLLAGGEREVLLDRGSSLDIVIRGKRPAQGFLRLRYPEEEDRRFTERKLPKHGPVHLEDLPAGDWLCTVEVGKWYKQPQRLGSIRLTIPPGQHVSGSIELIDQPGHETAPLSGTLRVPAAWRAHPRSLSLRGIEVPDGVTVQKQLKLARDATDLELWHWDAGSVAVGRHQLTYFELVSVIAFDLGPDGRRDVHMEIAPPVTVHVRAVEEATGQSLALERIFWSCQRPPGVSGGGIHTEKAVPGRDTITRTVPRTEIDLMVSLPGYQQTAESRQVSVTSDGQEIAVRMTRTYLIEVKLFDGEAHIPCERPWEAKVTALSGRGERVSVGGAEHFRAQVTQPGRYRVELPSVQGFESIPPFQVDVGQKGVTKKLALRRL